MMKFMNMLRRSKNKKGFTLTELIVVVTILGILTVVVAPSVVTYINDTKVQVDNANAKALENMILRGIAKGDLYYTDSGTVINMDEDTIGSNVDSTNANAIEVYVKNEIPSGVLPTCQQAEFVFYTNIQTGEVKASKAPDSENGYTTLLNNTMGD